MDVRARYLRDVTVASWWQAQLGVSPRVDASRLHARECTACNQNRRDRASTSNHRFLRYSREREIRLGADNEPRLGANVSVARRSRPSHVIGAGPGGTRAAEHHLPRSGHVQARRPPSTGHQAPDWPSRDALLEELRGGGRDALDRAMTLLYGELREIAHRLRLGRHARMDTLTLVHETYLKLADQRTATWNDRAHFLALAAVVMRHVLTDDARARLTSKREGNRMSVSIEERALAAPERPGVLLDVADALDRLERVDARLAHVVEYRFFGGLTNEEIGRVLGVDERTVRRDWARARQFLRDALGP